LLAIIVTSREKSLCNEYAGEFPFFKLHDAAGKSFQIETFRVARYHRVIGCLTELLYKLYITTSIYSGICDDFLK